MDPESDLAAIRRMIEACQAKVRILEDDIAVLEVQKDRLEALINRLVDAEKEMKALGVVPNVLPAEEEEWPQTDAQQKTAFERIVEFLRSRGNRPQTIAQIEQGTGIKRSSVSAVVYRTHSAHFYVREHSGKQPNTWQLKETVANGDYDDAPTSGGDEIPF